MSWTLTLPESEEHQIFSVRSTVPLRCDPYILQGGAECKIEITIRNDNSMENKPLRYCWITLYLTYDSYHTNDLIWNSPAHLQICIDVAMTGYRWKCRIRCHRRLLIVLFSSWFQHYLVINLEHLSMIASCYEGINILAIDACYLIVYVVVLNCCKRSRL